MGRSQQVNSSLRSRRANGLVNADPSQSGFLNESARNRSGFIDHATTSTVQRAVKTVQKRKAPPKKKHVGTMPLSDLVMLRRTKDPFVHSIPRAPFHRLVRGIMKNMGFDQYRISPNAIEAMQEVAEEKMLNDFERLNILARHANRVTVKPVDFEALRRLNAFDQKH